MSRRDSVHVGTAGEIPPQSVIYSSSSVKFNLVFRQYLAKLAVRVAEWMGHSRTQNVFIRSVTTYTLMGHLPQSVDIPHEKLAIDAIPRRATRKVWPSRLITRSQTHGYRYTFCRKPSLCTLWSPVKMEHFHCQPQRVRSTEGHPRQGAAKKKAPAWRLSSAPLSFLGRALTLLVIRGSSIANGGTGSHVTGVRRHGSHEPTHASGECGPHWPWGKQGGALWDSSQRLQLAGARVGPVAPVLGTMYSSCYRKA